MKNIFGLLLLFITSGALYAQKCGVTPDDNYGITMDLLKNKADIANGIVYERGIAYVPIKFHLVANDDASGRVTEAKVLDLLCGLNANYAPVGLQFYLSGDFSYVNDTRINTTPQDAFTVLFMKPLKAPNAINVFVTKTIGSSGTGGTILGYANYDNDFIVMLSTECKKEASTLTHELGHFFALLHTHNGWDGHPYDPVVDGKQVALISPSQAVKKGNYPGQNPQVTVKNECMSGLECDSRGDYVCDTPPDYAMGERWASEQKGCSKWSWIVLSPCGDTVYPMQTNYMSYFDNCASYTFTPIQIGLITASYNSARRNYLRNNILPVNNTVCSAAPVNLVPANNAVTDQFPKVELDWDDVPNATHYVLEISNFLDFIGDQFDRYVLTSSKFTMTKFKGVALTAGKNYWWRVRAYNNSSTCAPYSARFKFTTGTSNAISTLPQSLNSWSVVPNPSQASTGASLSINANQNIEPLIEIYDILGTRLSSFKAKVQIGQNYVPLDLRQSTKGLYFVSMILDNETYTQKLHIVE